MKRIRGPLFYFSSREGKTIPLGNFINMIIIHGVKTDLSWM